MHKWRFSNIFKKDDPGVVVGSEHHAIARAWADVHLGRQTCSDMVEDETPHTVEVRQIDIGRGFRIVLVNEYRNRTDVSKDEWSPWGTL